jgi:pyroglutamyl-peptidase
LIALRAEPFRRFTKNAYAAFTTASPNKFDQVLMNILLTGFGPFPGAPFNPTGHLVKKLARSRLIALTGARSASHVFVTSYESVDRDLPQLLARVKPDVWVMFGLASRARHVRIETRARNVRSSIIPDAGRRRPRTGAIAPQAAALLPLRAPTQRLTTAARSTGVKAALSHDAGRYLCNYLCWRATEAAGQPNGPRVAAFVHVPKVRTTRVRKTKVRKTKAQTVKTRMAGGPRRQSLTFERLMRAGEAIARAAIATARTAR